MTQAAHELQFIHYRPYSHLVGACIGYKVDPATLEAKFSVFVMYDSYSKKLGRVATEGRFRKGKTMEVIVRPDHIVDDVAEAARVFLARRDIV